MDLMYFGLFVYIENEKEWQINWNLNNNDEFSLSSVRKFVVLNDFLVGFSETVSAFLRILNILCENPD